MAQWIRRPPTERDILGSSPSRRMSNTKIDLNK